MSEFAAFAREDTEFALFHEELRRFRDVRSDGPAVLTRRGWRVKQYTAACPTDGTHRLVIEQTDGGARYTCATCSASPSRMARLGAALKRLLGYKEV